MIINVSTCIHKDKIADIPRLHGGNNTFRGNELSNFLCIYSVRYFFLIVIPNQFLTIEIIKQQVGYLDEQEGITFLTETDDYS